MLIGLISDTHGRVPEGVHDAFSNVDVIIHAGDIGSPAVMWELEAIAPVRACLGNNDWRDYGSSVQHEIHFQLGGARIAVTHFPEDAVMLARTGEYDLVVHGHTHVPRDTVVGECRVINPGSTTRPRQGSAHQCMTVRIEDGHIGPTRSWQL